MEPPGKIPESETEINPEVKSLSAVNPDEIISILKEEIENYDEISRDHTLYQCQLYQQAFVLAGAIV